MVRVGDRPGGGGGGVGVWEHSAACEAILGYSWAASKCAAKDASMVVKRMPRAHVMPLQLKLSF